MVDRQRKPIDRRLAYNSCNYARIITLVGGLLAMILAGVYFIFVYLISVIFVREFSNYNLVCAILFAVIALLSFLILIFGVLAKNSNKNWAMVCACLSVANASMAFSCFGVPSLGSNAMTVVIMTVIGALNIASTVLYINYWSKTPSNLFMHYEYRQVDEELVQKEEIRDKKKFAIALSCCAIAFAIVIGAVIPVRFYKNCGYVYDKIVYEMSKADGSDNLYKEYRLLKNLPENYRDVKELRSQFEYYIDCVKEYENCNNGVDTRNAVAKMLALKDRDSRWGLKDVFENKLLAFDATWQCDGLYLTLGEMGDDSEQEFYTNLPYILPEEVVNLSGKYGFYPYYKSQRAPIVFFGNGEIFDFYLGYGITEDLYERTLDKCGSEEEKAELEEVLNPRGWNICEVEEARYINNTFVLTVRCEGEYFYMELQ